MGFFEVDFFYFFPPYYIISSNLLPINLNCQNVIEFYKSFRLVYLSFGYTLFIRLETTFLLELAISS